MKTIVIFAITAGAIFAIVTGGFFAVTEVIKQEEINQNIKATYLKLEECRTILFTPPVVRDDYTEHQKCQEEAKQLLQENHRLIHGTTEGFDELWEEKMKETQQLIEQKTMENLHSP